jgi:hypothetical protein
MNEKLIAGYTAYTTADEYGCSATGDAPATTPILPWFALSVGAFAAGCASTYYSGHGC